ncbi:CAF17-like 4Fe-4S cluster assembly/insertion protein YgfZ [Glycomyces xiaoerkulensis]|uniref:CAF17-like 4Fe-4S cluster assembly/insertion protein YgfZ n=1 Tax=Glycomyces xiaoerkulensis TaxID=2038139 RepID=UPI000C266CC7|nr:folate-binding protein YgfZ [Glycomyces xiaoerkulensis]
MTETAPSPLLEVPGAVADDAGRIARHYGSPLVEQRKAAGAGAIFDRSDREIITVGGEVRLEWLHSLSTQHLTSLEPHQGTETLFLSPNGRVEHHAAVYDDGETAWLDTEPGAGEPLLKFLELMKFRTEVDIREVSSEWALLTYTYSESTEAPEPARQPVPVAKFASKDLQAVPTAVYAGAALDHTAGWTRRTDALREGTYDVMIRREDVAENFTGPDTVHAGSWAFDALRVQAGLPRFGTDTDERTVPHEVPAWLTGAIHLDKGCYRGQETVAKVHHMGQPPRRLVRLHLDGTDEHPPAPRTPVTLEGKEVGFVGTAVQHYEDGQIALAMLKRTVAGDPEARLTVGDQIATQ